MVQVNCSFIHSLTRESEAYVRENNPIQQWLHLQELFDEDFLRRRKEESDQAPVDPDKLAMTKILWENFMHWYVRGRYSAKAKPKKEEVMCYLEKTMGPREVVDKRNHKIGFLKWEFNQVRRESLPAWNNPAYQPFIDLYQNNNAFSKKTNDEGGKEVLGNVTSPSEKRK